MSRVKKHWDRTLARDRQTPKLEGDTAYQQQKDMYRCQTHILGGLKAVLTYVPLPIREYLKPYQNQIISWMRAVNNTSSDEQPYLVDWKPPILAVSWRLRPWWKARVKFIARISIATHKIELLITIAYIIRRISFVNELSVITEIEMPSVFLSCSNTVADYNMCKYISVRVVMKSDGDLETAVCDRSSQ